MLSRTFCLALLLGALLPLLPLSAQDQSSEKKEKDLPDGKGKDIVAAVCSQCHGLEAITSSEHTLEDWRNLVNGMVSNGAPLHDDEVEIVAQYLAKYFGPAKPSGSSDSKEVSSSPKVHVNKSTAKELETDLGLSQKEANAIVSYREKHGKFNNWEELKKVDGLDAKKMEAAKDRLVFQE